MRHIDYSLLQLQYEILGESPEKLALEYDTTKQFIDYAIESRGWKQRNVLSALSDWQDYDNIEEIDESLVEDVERRQHLLGIIKRKTLSPSYLALEASILGKCREVIENIDPKNPVAATQLKVATNIFESLSLVQSGGKGNKDDGKNGHAPAININIATRSSQIALGGGSRTADAGGNATKPARIAAVGSSGDAGGLRNVTQPSRLIEGSSA